MAIPAQASNPSTNDHIQGNVDLAAGVAVAPGVLLGAAPGCRLVISAGVCLGADVVVQARQGDLVLEPGVSLGSGVLVVGHGFIGQHTCIGANSTVINPALGASQVVAPASLLGDPSQALSTPPPQNHGNGAASSYVNGVNGSGAAGTGHPLSQAGAFSTSLNGKPAIASAQNGGVSSVYGKAQVNRLLSTLFPQRQPLNGASPKDKP